MKKILFLVISMLQITSVHADIGLLIKESTHLKYRKIIELSWPNYKGDFNGNDLSSVLGIILLSENEGNCESTFCESEFHKRTSTISNRAPVTEITNNEKGQKVSITKVKRTLTVVTEKIVSGANGVKRGNSYATIVRFITVSIVNQVDSSKINLIDPDSVELEVESIDNFAF